MVKILSENAISTADLKKELERIKKRDKELNFRGNKTEEYINQFVKNEKAAELAKKIEALKIPRLKDMHINKIIDIMPASVRDLKIVLQGYTITVSNENIKKIVDIANDSLPKK